MYSIAVNVGEGNSTSLQYSYLENPMDRGAWRATVHRDSESDVTEAIGHVHTHTHTHTHTYIAAYFFGEGDGTPLQYSCLENPMDGGAWWAAVHGVAKSRT